MIRWLLRALGAQDERPAGGAVRFPSTESEMHYECVRREAEQMIAKANRGTDVSNQQLVSWEDLFDPGRQR